MMLEQLDMDMPKEKPERKGVKDRQNNKTESSHALEISFRDSYSKLIINPNIKCKSMMMKSRKNVLGI
jgi:hypothetical protein